LGLPLLDRPKENLIIYTRVNFAGRPIYQIGISFFKIALLISYLRLLQGTNNKAYRIVVYCTIAGVFLTHLACAFSLIFACTPVDKSWNPLKDGTCLPPGPSFTAYAIVTIISDVVVAVLPVPLLLKLNIQKEKKFGLIGIFTLGLFTTLCSVFRYLQIDRIQFGDGNSTMLVLWGVIEFNVGVSVDPALYNLSPFSAAMTDHKLLFTEHRLVATFPRPYLHQEGQRLPFQAIEQRALRLRIWLRQAQVSCPPRRRRLHAQRQTQRQDFCFGSTHDQPLRQRGQHPAPAWKRYHQVGHVHCAGG
jgi:hypothetical protein